MKQNKRTESDKRKVYNYKKNKANYIYNYKRKVYNNYKLCHGSAGIFSDDWAGQRGSGKCDCNAHKQSQWKPMGLKHQPFYLLSV